LTFPPFEMLNGAESVLGRARWSRTPVAPPDLFRPSTSAFVAWY